MSSSLQNTSLQPSLKLQSRLDRIYASYIDEEVEAKLSAADKEYRERLEALWSLLINYHSPEQAFPMMKGKYGISRATYYRYEDECTKLFGDIRKNRKEAYRHILYEFAMKTFQLALSCKPPNLQEANKAIKNMYLLKGLNMNEQTGVAPELLEARTFLLQVVKANGKQKTINLDALEKLPDAEYAEIIEASDAMDMSEEEFDELLDDAEAD